MVVECELVLLEGGNNARPWSYNLLALVVADGECVSDSCLQGDAAFHHRLVDLQQQRIDGLSAAVSPLVGRLADELAIPAPGGNWSLMRTLPLSLQTVHPRPELWLAELSGLLRLPGQGLRINLRIKLVPDALDATDCFRRIPALAWV